MIRLPLIDRLRLRARAYALRVDTVDRLESELRCALQARDEARIARRVAEARAEQFRVQMMRQRHRRIVTSLREQDVDVLAARVRAATATAGPREAYDVDGDLEPPPGRPPMCGAKVAGAGCGRPWGHADSCRPVSALDLLDGPGAGGGA